MKKLTNLLEITEKDGALGAIGKGLINGAVASGTLIIGIGVTSILAGKLLEKDVTEVEVGE